METRVPQLEPPGLQHSPRNISYQSFLALVLAHSGASCGCGGCPGRIGRSSRRVTLPHGDPRWGYHCLQGQAGSERGGHATSPPGVQRGSPGRPGLCPGEEGSQTAWEEPMGISMFQRSWGFSSAARLWRTAACPPLASPRRSPTSHLPSQSCAPSIFAQAAFSVISRDYFKTRALCWLSPFPAPLYPLKCRYLFCLLRRLFNRNVRLWAGIVLLCVATAPKWCTVQRRQPSNIDHDGLENSISLWEQLRSSERE